jgi:hypothetical protein
MTATHRIVYRYEIDGRSFKVQELQPGGSYNRWKTVAGFTNVLAAKRGFPGAEVSDACLMRQLHVERPHAFQRDNQGSEFCHGCGRDFSHAAHQGGAR